MIPIVKHLLAMIKAILIILVKGVEEKAEAVVVQAEAVVAKAEAKVEEVAPVQV